MDNGNIFTYVWSTSAEGLANFVVRKNTPACQVLDDASAVEKFVKDNAKAAIAFYQGVAFDTFEAFEAYVNPQALNALHIPCAITKTSAAAGKYKKDSDSVTVFNGGKAVSRTTTELGELKDFIATYARSTVLTWGNNPWEEFLVADYQHLFLLADTAAAGYAEQLKEFTAAAETYISNEDGKKAKLVFGVIPMEANHELIWSEYHLLPTDGATLRFFNRPTKDFRQLPAGESITAASVAAFADGSLAGTSQKMPEKITSQKPREGHAPEEGSAISIVTAVDFHSFVAVEKDTILEFYAPWCGHCKKVAPEYEKLATNFAAIDSLQFGKIDGSKNDVNKMTDGIQIKGYPTFLLFPARAKNNVLRLSAQSSLETLTDFVREGAMIQFEYEGVTFGTGEAGDLSSQISDDELDEL
jgi:protein disulfide-isomerase A1